MNAAAMQRAWIRRQFRIGWTGLVFFMVFGVFLEALHGLKVTAYLGPGVETRRLMWTLAHAHGTLFSVVHLAMGAYFGLCVGQPHVRHQRAARWALVGLVAMPLGFLLGGAWIYEGDPGLGIFLVPVGAVAWIAAAVLLATDSWGADSAEGASGAGFGGPGSAGSGGAKSVGEGKREKQSRRGRR
jgi:hypothetical protein